MRPLLLIDIDGVVADPTHRLHFIQRETPDWDAFFEACDGDLPIMSMVVFLNKLQHFRLVHVTGRPERIRLKTQQWFDRYDVPWDDLLMRADGDHRPDHIVKAELADGWISHANVVAVIEDRDQVVAMWRKRGLLCLQPKKGDY